MASTKRIKVKYDDADIKSLYSGIMNQKREMLNDIAIYEKQSGKEFPLEFSEKKKSSDYDYINPSHYVQDDGRQTWERMIDLFGLEETAIFCKLNAYKYEERMGKKPNEDTEREQGKIQWYKDKANELFEKLKVEKKKTGGFFN